nr:hypothetical protein B0A51_14641 [Rachicladosporium sp. CCFEE 5018]
MSKRKAASLDQPSTSRIRNKIPQRMTTNGHHPRLAEDPGAWYHCTKDHYDGLDKIAQRQWRNVIRILFTDEGTPSQTGEPCVACIKALEPNEYWSCQMFSSEARALDATLSQRCARCIIQHRTCEPSTQGSALETPAASADDHATTCDGCAGLKDDLAALKDEVAELKRRLAAVESLEARLEALEQQSRDAIERVRPIKRLRMESDEAIDVDEEQPDRLRRIVTGFEGRLEQRIEERIAQRLDARIAEKVEDALADALG